MRALWKSGSDGDCLEHIRTKEYDSNGFQWDEQYIYQLMICPACDQASLRRYFWCDARMEPDDVKFEDLYPSEQRLPLGMPESVKRAYEAASRVRAIDANAYAVLVGRLLDMVCTDRGATGDTLHNRLQDLATKGEIPTKLVGVAHSVRGMRNVGAHADLGELTEVEVPIVSDLAKAILEYVYSAPYLAEQAARRLAAIKNP